MTRVHAVERVRVVNRVHAAVVQFMINPLYYNSVDARVLLPHVSIIRAADRVCDFVTHVSCGPAHSPSPVSNRVRIIGPRCFPYGVVLRHPIATTRDSGCFHRSQFIH